MKSATHPANICLKWRAPPLSTTKHGCNVSADSTPGGTAARDKVATQQGTKHTTGLSAGSATVGQESNSA